MGAKGRVSRVAEDAGVGTHAPAARRPSIVREECLRGSTDPPRREMGTNPSDPWTSAVRCGTSFGPPDRRTDRSIEGKQTHTDSPSGGWTGDLDFHVRRV